MSTKTPNGSGRTSELSLPSITPNEILAVLKEVARGQATVAQAARALTEASYQEVSTGDKVYVWAGLCAGYRGTLREIRGPYAEIEGRMGRKWFAPTVFLVPDGNAPS